MDRVRDWTVLVYMNNNNNLCQGAKGLLKNQLSKLEPDDRFSVAVEYSHLREPGYTYPASITHERATVVKNGLSRAESLPCQNMADPDTIASFLKWGMKAYPAQHYMVIFQSHGGAWRASMPDEAFGTGDEYDGKKPATISVPRLAEALKQVEAETGVKPDVLAFDSCLMSNTEAAFEMRDRAQVMVASEDIISSTPSEYALDYAVPLKPILQDMSDRLARGETLSADQVAAHWVDACSRSWTTPTQTALRLDQVEPLAAAVDHLAEALLAPTVDAATLKEVVHGSRHFSDKANPDKFDRAWDFKIHLYDLQDLAERIAADPRLGTAREAAEGVVAAVERAKVAHEAQPEVHAEGRTAYGDPMFARTSLYDAPRTHGLSIYLPDDPQLIGREHQDGNIYEDLALSHMTRWPMVTRKLLAVS